MKGNNKGKLRSCEKQDFIEFRHGYATVSPWDSQVSSVHRYHNEFWLYPNIDLWKVAGFQATIIIQSNTGLASSMIPENFSFKKQYEFSRNFSLSCLLIFFISLSLFPALDRDLHNSWYTSRTGRLERVYAAARRLSWLCSFTRLTGSFAIPVYKLLSEHLTI